MGKRGRFQRITKKHIKTYEIVHIRYEQFNNLLDVSYASIKPFFKKGKK